MDGRSPRQCRERWNHYLAPDLVLCQWTKEEETLLESQVTEHGRQWKTFESLFPGRTDINIKNNFMTLRRHQTPFGATSKPQIQMPQPLIVLPKAFDIVPMEQSRSPFTDLTFEQHTLELGFQGAQSSNWWSESGQGKPGNDSWFAFDAF
jgi:hypothetical protein